MKDFMDIKELAEYTGYKVSTIYKFTHCNKIKFYRPSGKKIFFKLEDVNKFLFQNEVNSIDHRSEE